MAPKVCKRPAVNRGARPPCKRPAVKYNRGARPPSHSGARPACGKTLAKELALAVALARADRAEAAAASAHARADRAEAAAEVMGKNWGKAEAEVAALAKLTGEKLGKDTKGGSGSGRSGNGSVSGW